MFGAFFLYYFSLEFQIWCVVASSDGSVMCQFCDFDPITRIIVSGAYLINYLRDKSQICCMDTSLDADVSHTILGHCDLDL